MRPTPYVLDTLEKLRPYDARGIRFSRDGNTLVVRGKLTPEDAVHIRAMKHRILEALTDPDSMPCHGCTRCGATSTAQLYGRLGPGDYVCAACWKAAGRPFPESCTTSVRRDSPKPEGVWVEHDLGAPGARQPTARPSAAQVPSQLSLTCCVGSICDGQ